MAPAQTAEEWRAFAREQVRWTCENDERRELERAAGVSAKKEWPGARLRATSITYEKE
jgi:hypothetical protein